MWRGEGVGDLFGGGPKVKASQVFGPFYVACSRLTCGAPAEKQQRSLVAGHFTLLNRYSSLMTNRFKSPPAFAPVHRVFGGRERAHGCDQYAADAALY